MQIASSSHRRRRRAHAVIDYILYFQAAAWAFFGASHILDEGGNIKNMGWELAQFMPGKAKVKALPVEVDLCMTHICAILGSMQLTLVVMCVLAAKSKSKEVKTMALRVVLVGQVLVTAMQFYKPSGTGAEGSPATGPIPVIIAMARPVVYANFIA